MMHIEPGRVAEWGAVVIIWALAIACVVLLVMFLRNVLRGE